nr:Probable amino-acid metabolite efflux pump [Klebsiella pneumoniae]
MGLNFVVIKLGLHNMPPLMLAGLRFMLVAFRRCCLSPGQLFRCACCWAMA